MKRNEKILVYAVTGFLAVVLAIAVFFGNDKLPGRQPKNLGDLMAAASDTNAKSGAAGAGEIGRSGAEAAGRAGEGGATPSSAVENASGTQESEGAGQFVLDASSRRPELSAEDRLTMLIGSSTVVDRQWRRVVVAQGDSISTIAQKWCGTTARTGDIRRLNEGVSDRSLQPGDRLLLPYVDAETLIEAHDARVAAAATRGSAGPAPVGPTVAGANYTVVAGDSAWRIAEKFVSRNQAPRFIEELKRLNPQIENIDRLSAGDQLRLPDGQQ